MGAPSFDVQHIPSKIQDLLVINTETLKDTPSLGNALVASGTKPSALMKTIRQGKSRARSDGKIVGQSNLPA